MDNLPWFGTYEPGLHFETFKERPVDGETARAAVQLCHDTDRMLFDIVPQRSHQVSENHFILGSGGRVQHQPFVGDQGIGLELVTLPKHIQVGSALHRSAEFLDQLCRIPVGKQGPEGGYDLGRLDGIGDSTLATEFETVVPDRVVACRYIEEMVLLVICAVRHDLWSRSDEEMLHLDLMG
jgi:hypothetical protein